MELLEKRQRLLEKKIGQEQDKAREYTKQKNTKGIPHYPPQDRPSKHVGPEE
jgi:hypothetical protein